MTIEEMKDRIKETGYSYRHVSELSGVPLSTIQKIFSGVTSTPRYETLRALESVLMPRHSFEYDIPEAQPGCFEDAATYKVYIGEDYGIPGKKQGEYTVEDYYKLPDDRRVELIDGVFYDMASPSGYHQYLAAEIHFTLLSQSKEQHSPCRPFISPLDVQLDNDNKTILQPDVFGTCDPSAFKNGRFYGAPDFIIEILSPSSAKKDMYIKGHKYAVAGVREYWIVDLKMKRVLVNIFEDDVMLHIYSITDDIPIGISGGKFHVDFSEIYSGLTEYFPELNGE